MPDERHPFRAWVSEIGPARVDIDADEDTYGLPGSALAADRNSFPGMEVVVADDLGERVRIVDERYSVRYALWVRREHLAQLPGRRVALATAPTGRPAPGTARKSAVVELAGGTRVTIRERRRSWIRVEFKEAGVSVSGWIPAERMAHIYRASLNPMGKLEDTLVLKRVTEVLDRAGGVRIATLGKDDVWGRAMRRLGPAVDGLAPIEVTTARILVRGVVPADSVADKPPSLRGGGGGGSGWGASHTTWLEAPVGTVLHIEPNGPVFAVVAADYSRIVLSRERRGDWSQIRFRTPWGMVEGWLPCPAFRRVGPTTYRCTDRSDPDKTLSLPNW